MEQMVAASGNFVEKEQTADAERLTIKHGIATFGFNGTL